MITTETAAPPSWPSRSHASAPKFPTTLSGHVWPTGQSANMFVNRKVAHWREPSRGRFSAPKKFAAGPEMVEMNRKHCVIDNMGGKFVIVNETIDPVSGEGKITFS